MLPSDLAKKLAHQAGTMIRQNFSRAMTKQWKADHTPVTATDLAINTLVLTEIEKHFPDHSILAEEESKIKPSEFVWVCDPIDGTTPFSHGIPTCVFSLALVHHGHSILSVIYDPFVDRLFFAEKGRGAYLNDQKISVNSNTLHDRNLIGIVPSRRHEGFIIKMLQYCRTHNINVVSLGSTIYMGMLVASGELSASIFAGRKAHDSAALKVLIDEAGGTMTSLFGEEQKYDGDVNGHLITNGPLHADFLHAIKAATQENKN